MADSPRIEELKRRVQLDPASITFAALAEEYRRAGRLEEAIATCTAGLHRHPAYLSTHVTLGRSLIEVGHFADARDELEYVLKLAPENLAAIRGLAEIHHRRGDDDHAHHTAALDEHARSSAAGPAPSPAPQFAASGPADETVDPQYGVSDPGFATKAAQLDPALAGLETFLSAIERARDERAVGR